MSVLFGEGNSVWSYNSFDRIRCVWETVYVALSNLSTESVVLTSPSFDLWGVLQRLTTLRRVRELPRIPSPPTLDTFDNLDLPRADRKGQDDSVQTRHVGQQVTGESLRPEPVQTYVVSESIGRSHESGH